MLAVSRLTVAYKRGLSDRSDRVAVHDISFSINTGEILGLIGESGSGKSTLLNAIAGLIKPQSGTILHNGKVVASLPKRDFAMLFQSAALNPKLRLYDCIAEPLRNARKFHRNEAYINELLALVKLPSSYSHKYPHELSGGELQRAAIARALAMKPSVLLADEPVSALDASVRGHVLDLLRNLCRKLNLTCIFVTHDMGVARYMCDSFCVMKHGNIVEQGSHVLDSPENTYTKLLVASILPLSPEQRESSRNNRTMLWVQYKREEGGYVEHDFTQAGAVRCSNDFA